MTYRTDEDHARETGPTWRLFKGTIRRLLVTLTSSASKWQLTGVRSRLGGDEVYEAELFPGIGIFARPPDGGSAEAIALAIGGHKLPAIVATRDEATRRMIASQVEAGETALYNAAGIVVLKSNGTIEIRSHGGTSQATIRGSTYRSAEDTLLTALGTFATAIGALNPVTASGAATTLNTAITNFKAAAASYLTTVARVE